MEPLWPWAGNFKYVEVHGYPVGWMHLHGPPCAWPLSFFLRRNSLIALGSMAACPGCFAVCSLPVSIWIWGRRSPLPCLFWIFKVRICALCAAPSTGRGRFHLEAPAVTATQTVGKIKASLSFCFFLAILLLSAWLPLLDDILTQEERNL